MIAINIDYQIQMRKEFHFIFTKHEVIEKTITQFDTTYIKKKVKVP